MCSAKETCGRKSKPQGRAAAAATREGEEGPSRPGVWLGLFTINDDDDDDDDEGGPGISILVYGDNRVPGLFVADDCEVPLSLWVTTC